MNIESPTSTICPLMSIGKVFPEECKREDCAWWYARQKGEESKVGCCALVSAADNLADMNLIGVSVYGG